MKSHSLIFLSVGFLLATACNSGPQTASETNEQHVSNDQLLDILNSENGYTFDDLHQYYLSVKQTKSNEPNYDDVRRKVMFHMYSNQTLVEHEDQAIIEFYTNEILGMDYISDMHLLALLLTRLKGYWEIEKIRTTAEQAYERNMKYIYANFSDPASILQKQGVGPTRLSRISALQE